MERADQRRGLAIMSESISNHESGIGIDEATKEEERAIRDEFDEFARSGIQRLHIQRLGFEDPAPLCERERGGGIPDDLVVKSEKAYPIGYRPICRYCVEAWRRSE